MGIRDTTQDEYDIIMEIRNLHNRMSTTVHAIWVEGHPTNTGGE
jgi:hypothetical protein